MTHVHQYRLLVTSLLSLPYFTTFLFEGKTAFFDQIEIFYPSNVMVMILLSTFN